MTANQIDPDATTISLDYNLALMLATHVEQSDAYNSREEFVHEALWDKLCTDYECSEVLEAFIAWQEERVATVKHEAQQSIREYEQEITRLQEAQRDFEHTIETEAEEFWRQLENADYETR